MGCEVGSALATWSEVGVLWFMTCLSRLGFLWRATASGQVERPLEVSMPALMESYPYMDLAAPFHCITGWSVERMT